MFMTRDVAFDQSIDILLLISDDMNIFKRNFTGFDQDEEYFGIFHTNILFTKILYKNVSKTMYSVLSAVEWDVESVDLEKNKNQAQASTSFQ